MSTMMLSQLLQGLGSVTAEAEISGLALDSRSVTKGDLFFAVQGQGRGRHGLAHLQQAITRGAAAVAWEPAPGIDTGVCPIPAVRVEGLAHRVGEIAARFHGAPSQTLFVAGVTGTDGKTSTAHLVAQGLEQLGEACAYFGTLGTGRLDALQAATHTTLDPVSLQQQFALMREAGIGAVAMEVSSHALQQNRVGGVAFDAVVLTNLHRDHLDYHGTEAAYAAAKFALFAPADARALIVNRDDEWGRRWLQTLDGMPGHRQRLVVFGVDGPAPADRPFLIARDLQLHAAGLGMRVHSDRGIFQIESSLLGRFNAYNLLAAAAVLLHRGYAPDDVGGALSRTRTVPGRIEGFRGPPEAPLMVVDYAHTPQALQQILTAVRQHCTGEVWCVFGCGGDRDRGKRPLMGQAAAELADHLIITDDNPRGESPAEIAAQIASGVPVGSSLRILHDRADAIRFAASAATAGDVVVVAGKGHEDYQIHGTQRRTFSDRDFVSRLQAQRGADHASQVTP